MRAEDDRGRLVNLTLTDDRFRSQHERAFQKQLGVNRGCVIYFVRDVRARRWTAGEAARARGRTARCDRSRGAAETDFDVAVITTQVR